ncbi:BZ3500_MvSof-1268-A1-R1_Chr6-3g08998 [Microbotryum saponariae]|uniref:BZ3500_MvSof-1268-A1-R1_Chr6-3g08998 protein n=1 Tax=Microbotryum saponariae TaxID=289078 RepID=A0A2X0LQ14_9BASI|nr:BZ3500_MvSof-1268-A1-R1_Chr6-3g08998 [Microbotryum saponariae]SDA07600.1 BZ3501_MvSof-1269-A2-R1_Chr6-2g08702 [Microbotryum saponariae]
MPNAKRSGAAQRTKKAANAKAAAAAGTSTSSSTTNGASASSSSSRFGHSGEFTFSSPPPRTSRKNTNGGKSSPSAQKRGHLSPIVLSSDSDDDGDDDDDDDDTSSEEEDDSNDAKEADSDVDMGDREKPDHELTAEEKLVRAAERKETGNEYYKKKDYPTATRYYSQAISLDPTNPTYLTNRAASRMESRVYTSALEDLLAAAALQAKDPQVKTLLRLGKCQTALGLVSQAQQTLDQAFKMDSTNVGVQNERKKVARIQNALANVKRDLEKKDWSMVLLGIDAAAREVEETPREWRTWKVQALVGKKQYDQAAGMAADLLRANQNQPEALYYRGLCLYYAGNHPQAIAHCQQALRNDPDYVLARTLLRQVKLVDSLKDAGNEAFKSNRLDEAIAKYSEALVVDPENDVLRATLLSNRATAQLKLKKYDEALGDCEACLTLQPQYWKAMRTKARICLAQEEWEGAVHAFKQAYEIAPAGSNDEAALKREVADAEAKLKRSKMKDHYNTLGISSTASEDEIKKAYRKQSLIHHPDKGGSDASFKEVGEAYAILSDPQRRRKFDMGIDENDPHAGHGGGDDFGFGGGVDLSDLFGAAGGFGGGAGFGGGGRRQYHSHQQYGF